MGTSVKDISMINVEFDVDFFDELLKEKGLNRVQLAKITGVNYFTLLRYTARTHSPTAKTLYLIALALEVPMDDLMKEI